MGNNNLNLKAVLSLRRTHIACTPILLFMIFEFTLDNYNSTERMGGLGIKKGMHFVVDCGNIKIESVIYEAYCLLPLISYKN